MDIFCSTIIPTINRPTLTRAVESVLNQAFTAAEYEIIVVNDSGQPLPEMKWQHSARVQVIHTNRHERCIARNTGAAIARGKYLHFLDDDDYILPGTMNTFWTMEKDISTIWLFGSYQTIDNHNNLVAEFHPMDMNGNNFALLVAGESIPLQASLINTESFFKAGAFDPQFTVTEDRDLGRRLALLGTASGSETVVVRIRIGQAGSSSNWAIQPECDRLGREKALQIQKSYIRLLDSAKSSYLHGRVCRAYLASMIWNLKHKSLATALNRAWFGMLFAGYHSLSLNFWRGIRTKIR
jgi:glycosyltransferase involved in cell wall biosynthesis